MASLKLATLTRLIRSCAPSPANFCRASLCRVQPVDSLRPVSNVTVLREYSTEEAKSKQEETADTTMSELEKKCKEEIEALTKDLNTYKDKSKEIEDKYKRALADGENLRKRMSKQVEDAKTFSIQSFCKDLLDVADALSKATDSVPKDQVSEANPHLKNLFDGLTLTEAQLMQVFRRHGLEPVNPLKEKFNPNLHEALFAQAVEGAEPGTVVVVSKIGYKLQERCVRPALVGVAKGV